MKTFSCSQITYWIGKILLLGTVLYFGYKGIFNPEMFVRLIPAWAPAIFSATTMVIIHGIIMSITAILVFFNKGGRWAYFILLLMIVAVLLSVRGMTLYRDLAIFGGLLILGQNHFNKKTV